MRAYCTAQDYSFGPTMADVKLDGGHPEFTDPESRERMAERQIIAGMRAAGVTTELDPEITDATLNEAGTVITLTIDLPNGGDLQTQWGFDGTEVPSGFTDLQGFEIWENAAGATKANRRNAVRIERSLCVICMPCCSVLDTLWFFMVPPPVN